MIAWSCCRRTFLWLSRGSLVGCLLLGMFVTGCGSRADTVVAIAIHPAKPHIMYVATDEAVYKSRDSGDTWQRLGGELERTRVTNLTIDPMLPANVLAGTLSDGVYKSPDGGNRWLVQNAGIQKGTISINVQQLVFAPGSSDTIYAATTVGLFRSTDGGQTWTERMRGMKEVNFVVCVAVDPLHPNVVYAGTTGGMYRSLDATESWTKINHGLLPEDAKMASMALGVNALGVDPETPTRIYAGTTQGLFRSSDRGESWSRIGESILGDYVSTLAIDARMATKVYVGTSEGLFRTDDAGDTWTAIEDGLANSSIRVVRLDPQESRKLYCGTNGNGLFRSVDGGSSWEKLSLVDNS